MRFLLVFLFLFSPILAKEPKFLEYQAVSQSKSTNVTLNDVESHLKNNLGYVFDELGRAHEWSHLINGEARASLKVNGGEVLYCLKNRVVVLKDTTSKINDVRNIVPNRLRGKSSESYLTDEKFRNKNAINLFNEWTAYTNGATYAVESNTFGWELELLQAHHFNVYCTYVAMMEGDSLDPQTRDYLKWNIERTFELQTKRPSKRVSDYLAIVKTDETLRDFLQTQFGQEWYNTYYEH